MNDFSKDDASRKCVQFSHFPFVAFGGVTHGCPEVVFSPHPRQCDVVYAWAATDVGVVKLARHPVLHSPATFTSSTILSH